IREIHPLSDTREHVVDIEDEDVAVDRCSAWIPSDCRASAGARPMVRDVLAVARPGARRAVIQIRALRAIALHHPKVRIEVEGWRPPLNGRITVEQDLLSVRRDGRKCIVILVLGDAPEVRQAVLVHEVDLYGFPWI